MENIEPCRNRRDYNDDKMTVTITLKEYRDLLADVATLSQTCDNLSFRLSSSVNAVQSAKEETEVMKKRYSELQSRYSWLEEWLGSSSYYSGIFEEWLSRRDNFNKFSNEALKNDAASIHEVKNEQ